MSIKRAVDVVVRSLPILQSTPNLFPVPPGRPNKTQYQEPSLQEELGGHREYIQSLRDSLDEARRYGPDNIMEQAELAAELSDALDYCDALLEKQNAERRVEEDPHATEPRKIYTTYFTWAATKKTLAPSGQPSIPHPPKVMRKSGPKKRRPRSASMFRFQIFWRRFAIKLRISRRR